MSELKYWVWLSEHIRTKNAAAMALLENFTSPEAIYFARESEYAHIPELTPQQIESLTDKNMADVNRALQVCDDEGYRIMTITDADYPARLKNIYSPPLVLYVRGKLPIMDEEVAVSMVGTRSCTPYGLKTAERIAYEITRAGGLIVTGLAAGVDTAAARGALRAGGRVVGVLGCGLDVIYPKFNGPIYDDVAATGAIISEYMPGTEPRRGNFPERNRIMSGISLGTVVVEAPEKSGALITAACALEQGRDVFAVPGNVDAASCAGSNALLKEGAVPVTSGWDVTDVYAPLFPAKLGRTVKENVPLDSEGEERLVKNLPKTAKKDSIHIKKEIDNEKSVGYIVLTVKREELSADELAVLSVMSPAPMQADDITEASGLPAARVLSTLTMMQIKGWVEQTPGKNFSMKITLK